MGGEIGCFFLGGITLDFFRTTGIILNIIIEIKFRQKSGLVMWNEKCVLVEGVLVK